MGRIPNISAAMCARGRSIDSPALSPDGRFAACAASDGAGRRLVIVPVAGGPEQVIAVDPAPGSFAWLPHSGGLVYTSAEQLCLVPTTGGPGRTVVQREQRVAAPAVSPDGTRVAYVVDDRDVEVAPLDGGPVVRLTADNDFAFDPAWSPDSATVAWHEWDVPDMPWDAGRIASRPADASAAKTLWCDTAAVQQPRFSADGRLGWLSDESGWLNVWVDGRPAWDEPFEHGDPAWGHGQRSWCFSPDGAKIAVNRNENGFGRLIVVDLATGGTTELGKGVHRWLSWAGDTIAAWRSGAKTPTQVVVYQDGGRRTLAHGPVAGFEPALAEPEPVTLNGVPALVYGPQPARHLMVQVHGGPVGQNQVIFDAKTAFWLDRGWTVLVPDFRGSTGHGRAHQQAINGGWGDVDIDDIAAATHAVQADPARTVVVGGSSGGMAVLLLLARYSELFAAGVASYPVVDLIGLAASTHRFEAHSNDRLVGTSRKVLKARSPLAHLDRISKPLLVFHGLDDEVVPPRQSRALVRKLRAQGKDVEHVEYPGEGHGFRRAATVEDQLRRTEAFLVEKVIG